MNKEETIISLLQRMDTATTDIAGDLKKLRDEIAADSISTESMQKLEANIIKLEALGKEEDAPAESVTAPVDTDDNTPG